MMELWAVWARTETSIDHLRLGTSLTDGRFMGVYSSRHVIESLLGVSREEVETIQPGYFGAIAPSGILFVWHRLNVGGMVDTLKIYAKEEGE